MSIFTEEAAAIRRQLSGSPKRKTFRKTRDKLLDIAIALETAEAVMRDIGAYERHVAREDAA